MTTATHPRAHYAVAVDRWWLLAVGSVLVAVVLASTFTPDLISGSQQEHVPLAALTDWIWGSVAVAYLAFLRARDTDPTVAISVSLLWLAVALGSIFAPDLVTGSDPTRIPLAGLIAPVVGAIATGFLCLHGLRSDA